MSNQILVPSLGESITEATVSKWLKQVGEEVDSDEPIVELETDKVNLECPSPCSGTLASIKVKEGSIVEVGSLLGIVTEEKSSSIKTVKTDTVDQELPSYMPPKTSKKKNIVKETLKKRKKTIPEKQEPITLIDESKYKNSNGALILDTLADGGANETRE